MKELTVSEALEKGYKFFCFRRLIYPLNKESLEKVQKTRKPEDFRDVVYLADGLDYSLKIIPEEIIYNCTEELYQGCYNQVINTEAFKKWKKSCEDFVEAVKDTTQTFNVTEIKLII